VGFAQMIGDIVWGNVPAAIIAGRHVFVTLLAKKRATAQKLLEPGPFFIGQVNDISRQRLLLAALIARAGVILGQDRREVFVQAAWHYAIALAQGAGHTQVRDNGFANKRALVRQLVEKLGEFLFHLERHNLSFRRLSRHVSE
jgi:hypothetical protein